MGKIKIQKIMGTQHSSMRHYDGQPYRLVYEHEDEETALRTARRYMRISDVKVVLNNKSYGVYLRI